MGIVGNLRTMQLEELLQWLSQSQKTGTLEIKTDKVEKKIFFRDGPDRGHGLDRARGVPRPLPGQPRPDQRERSWPRPWSSRRPTGMLLGKILVTKEILKESDLHQMLKPQEPRRASTTSSPGPRGTSASSTTCCPQANAMVPMVLDVTGILMEGVQRVDEFRRIRQAHPHRRTPSRSRSASWELEARRSRDEADPRPGERRAHGGGDPSPDALQRVPRLQGALRPVAEGPPQGGQAALAGPVRRVPGDSDRSPQRRDPAGSGPQVPGGAGLRARPAPPAGGAQPGAGRTRRSRTPWPRARRRSGRPSSRRG